MELNNTLSTIDIIDFPILRLLTGFDSPSKQAKCLNDHNVFFIEGKDGKITTTSKWLEQAASAVNPSAQAEVNLDF
jgi:hypothetical protein